MVTWPASGRRPRPTSRRSLLPGGRSRATGYSESLRFSSESSTSETPVWVPAFGLVVTGWLGVIHSYGRFELRGRHVVELVVGHRPFGSWGPGGI
ncbi:MAG: hypothetical protein Ct9H300mP1_24570 [Planctomycetaceae bacterium]|nr:MAG: hypothetical protein Ct9H300mP1_24570 [Planctomycetaceae bacterium]